jgi:hypothetical protein
VHLEKGALVGDNNKLNLSSRAQVKPNPAWLAMQRVADTREARSGAELCHQLRVVICLQLRVRT